MSLPGRRLAAAEGTVNSRSEAARATAPSKPRGHDARDAASPRPQRWIGTGALFLWQQSTEKRCFSEMLRCTM